MQFAPQAGFERLVFRMLRGVGRDRRWIFGMEIAAPVHVVAQEFDDELFQQAVVLAIGAEEAGIEHALLRIGAMQMESGRTVDRGARRWLQGFRAWQRRGLRRS